MAIGDAALSLAFGAGIITIILLIINQLGKGTDISAPLKWLIRIFCGLLVFDLSLLTYYFLTSNFTINYVWTFSSRDLPVLYKLSGVLAGQQGTLLFWAVFIGLSSLWLSERREGNDFLRKSQIVLLTLGVFFIGLTIKDSPFNTIYHLYPDLLKSFVPPDGNGLNPLLIDPWMAVHPPVIFIAYGAMGVPFAFAVVHLFKSLTDSSEKFHKVWIKDVIMWCRVSWIFLTLGIAVGGFWAYKVLGWGGFWAWDPVETSSLVPWFLLTGALHALIEHKKDRTNYTILSPLMVALSFTLILYATLVTRSGFFESVHAFGVGETGLYILIMTAASALLPLILAGLNFRAAKYQEEEKITFMNRTNIFYLAIVLFLVLTFVSFWGITYPAISKLTSGNKIGIGAHFFNIWSYPVIIATMLLAGLALTYKESTKEKSKRELLIFSLLTIAAGFIRPTDSWNLADYSAIVNPNKPYLYSLIGSISILSFIPPSAYMVYSSIGRFNARRISPKKEFVIKELGISIIHIGAVLIILGSVFSYALDSEFQITLNSDDEGKLTQIPESPYAVKLLGFDTIREYKGDNASYSIPGLSVGEFFSEIHSGIKDSYTIHGYVEEVIQTPHTTYVRLTEGEEEIWVATDTSAENIQKGRQGGATGTVNANFKSSFLNMTFPLLLLAPNFESPLGREIFSTTQEVILAVYKGDSEIASGTARSIEYFNGDVQKVMIDRGIMGDVYVIFNGITEKDIFLDVRIKPQVNLVWAGIIFFTIGMLAVLASSSATIKGGK